MHFYIDKHDSKKKSSHLLKDCCEFLKLHEALARMNRDVVNRGYGVSLGVVAHGAPPTARSTTTRGRVQNHGGEPYP